MGSAMTARVALVLGSLAMFLAVALGAFGAHALKARLSGEMAGVSELVEYARPIVEPDVGAVVLGGAIVQVP